MDPSQYQSFDSFFHGIFNERNLNSPLIAQSPVMNEFNIHPNVNTSINMESLINLPPVLKYVIPQTYQEAQTCPGSPLPYLDKYTRHAIQVQHHQQYHNNNIINSWHNNQLDIIQQGLDPDSLSSMKTRYSSPKTVRHIHQRSDSPPDMNAQYKLENFSENESLSEDFLDHDHSEDYLESKENCWKIFLSDEYLSKYFHPEDVQIKGKGVRISKTAKNYEQYLSGERKIVPRELFPASPKTKAKNKSQSNGIDGNKLIEYFKAIKDKEQHDDLPVVHEEINNAELTTSGNGFRSKLSENSQDKTVQSSNDNAKPSTNTRIPPENCCQKIENELFEAAKALNGIHMNKDSMGSRPMKNVFDSKSNNRYYEKIREYEDHMNLHMNQIIRPSFTKELEKVIASVPSSEPSILIPKFGNLPTDGNAERSLENKLRNQVPDIWGSGKIGLFAETPNQFYKVTSESLINSITSTIKERKKNRGS